VIVVDTSAVIAILNREAGFENLLLKLLKDTERRISPVASLELVMVLSRNHDNPATEANAYLRQENIALYPIDSTLTEWAHYAFLTYGKGRHPAKLNIADCFSYAMAKASNAPLLYVGEDFAKTDIPAA
jgi:ribonuclease VapC